MSPSCATASSPVLIIGAGLGGLTLARCLSNSSIPYRIFERSPNASARFEGWALTLHSWLVQDFSQVLPNVDLRNLSVMQALGLRSQFKIYALGKNGEIPQTFCMEDTEERPMIRADRAKLREALLEGVTVEWGKRFVKFDVTTSGNDVKVCFEDGEEATGCMVVGADGIGSQVRRQLLSPNPTEPEHLPLGVIVGEVEATQAQYMRWLELGRSFYIGMDGTRRIFVGLKSVSEDKTRAKYYWIFNWKDEAAAKPNYWTATATREQLHAYVMANLDGLNDDFVEPLKATHVDGMLWPPLQMRDMVPPPLPTGRVTLLGDAVHPMVPFKGEGANMAMKDAVSLAQVLRQVSRDGIEAALKNYEQEMSERAGKSVLASRAATMEPGGK